MGSDCGQRPSPHEADCPSGKLLTATSIAALVQQVLFILPAFHRMPQFTQLLYQQPCLRMLAILATMFYVRTASTAVALLSLCSPDCLQCTKPQVPQGLHSMQADGTDPRLGTSTQVSCLQRKHVRLGLCICCRTVHSM